MSSFQYREQSLTEVECLHPLPCYSRFYDQTAEHILNMSISSCLALQKLQWPPKSIAGHGMFLTWEICHRFLGELYCGFFWTCGLPSSGAIHYVTKGSPQNRDTLHTYTKLWTVPAILSMLSSKCVDNIERPTVFIALDGHYRLVCLFCQSYFASWYIHRGP